MTKETMLFQCRGIMSYFDLTQKELFFVIGFREHDVKANECEQKIAFLHSLIAENKVVGPRKAHENYIPLTMTQLMALQEQNVPFQFHQKMNFLDVLAMLLNGVCDNELMSDDKTVTIQGIIGLIDVTKKNGDKNGFR